jgi:sporulation protein YlmC with PRC-barrel domain
MKLTKDARIITAEGNDIGNLNRFVMDPLSKHVTHIVFETRGINRVEHVIPMQMVQQVDEHGIHLRPLPEEEANTLPLFEEKKYIIADESALVSRGMVSDESIHSYYHYPPAPFGESGTMRPMDVNTPAAGAAPFVNPGVPVSGESPVVRQVEQNIPEGTVALKEGAMVMTSDSKHVGNVEKVLLDPRTARATHLMIASGLLFRERKIVPTEWVETVLENEILLGIDSRFAERLPDYHPE